MDGAPGDDFAIMGIDEESRPDDIAVPAGELRPVRAPAQVRTHHHDLAVMAALRPVKAGSLRQQVVVFHDATDSFVVDGR